MNNTKNRFFNCSQTKLELHFFNFQIFKFSHLQIILLFFTFHISHFTFAQDIHFSQFYASPLTLNPALTGVFKGDYRFVGNYKNQWNSVPAPYETFSASYDMHLIRGFKKGDAISAGIVMFNDKAGDSHLTNLKTDLLAAYSLSFGEYTHQYLSVGIQVGYGQRSINYNELLFDNQIENDQFNIAKSNGETNLANNYSYYDFSTGALWHYSPNEKFNLYAGSSLYHVNKPGQSFLGIEDRLHRKFVLHGGSQFYLNKQYSLLPSILFLNQKGHRELMMGSFVKFDLDKKYGFYAGLWHRLKDSFVLALRIDIDKLTLGISYDINSSSLINASHLRAGPELSLIYVGIFPAYWKLNRGRGKMNCPTFNHYNWK